jgi:hypothetical protein
MPKQKGKQIRDDASVDPYALVMQVLRESYLQNIEDLRSYAEKVHDYNQCKKTVRDYLRKLRDYRANVICAVDGLPSVERVRSSRDKVRKSAGYRCKRDALPLS